MTAVSAIARIRIRLSTHVPEAGLQYNQFLARDEQPLLLHTGMRGLFPAIVKALARLIDPAAIRWIGFS
jgi:flavorubredoxin